jgi:ectoine hydroxylase-related dioxygenase (phytanoyl-CoA dioxygenase family)
MHPPLPDYAVENPQPFAPTPFSAEKTREIIATYNREGCVLIPQVLSPNEVEALKAGIDRVFDDPRAKQTDTFAGDYIAVRLFEWGNLFRDLLVREPIISVMEAIFGTDCHLIANNIVRNGPGQAISTYHVDDRLMYPLPEGVARYDSHQTFPMHLLNVQMALTDIEAEEYGPTQYVPESHFSGRQPNDQFDPTWEGRKGVSILCKAGDVYFQHGQVWHRGAPNTSTRTRYLLQHAFASRMISQRFYPFLNYRMPDQVLEGAGERLLRVLGKHPKGPYG